jgi:hypothetical protein
MAQTSGQFGARWLSAKRVFVIALATLHGTLAGNLRRASAGPARPVPRYLGYAPGFIAVSAAAIAIFAVAKPF